MAISIPPRLSPLFLHHTQALAAASPPSGRLEKEKQHPLVSLIKGHLRIKGWCSKKASYEGLPLHLKQLLHCLAAALLTAYRPLIQRAINRAERAASDATVKGAEAEAALKALEGNPKAAVVMDLSDRGGPPEATAAEAAPKAPAAEVDAVPLSKAELREGAPVADDAAPATGPEGGSPDRPAPPSGDPFPVPSPAVPSAALLPACSSPVPGATPRHSRHTPALPPSPLPAAATERPPSQAPEPAGEPRFRPLAAAVREYLPALQMVREVANLIGVVLFSSTETKGGQARLMAGNKAQLVTQGGLREGDQVPLSGPHELRQWLRRIWESVSEQAERCSPGSKLRARGLLDSLKHPSPAKVAEVLCKQLEQLVPDLLGKWEGEKRLADAVEAAAVAQRQAMDAAAVAQKTEQQAAAAAQWRQYVTQQQQVAQARQAGLASQQQREEQDAARLQQQRGQQDAAGQHQATLAQQQQMQHQATLAQEQQMQLLVTNLSQMPQHQFQAAFPQLPQQVQALLIAQAAQLLAQTHQRGPEVSSAAASPTQQSSSGVATIPAGSSALPMPQQSFSDLLLRRVAEGVPQQNSTREIQLGLHYTASPGRSQHPLPAATIPASPARIPPAAVQQQQQPVGAHITAAVQPAEPCAAVQQASAGPSRPGECPPRVLDLKPCN